MRIKCILLLCFAIMFGSCTEKKKHLSFFDNLDMEEDSTEVFETSSNTTITYYPGEEVSVPFIEQGGVKLIDVTINSEFTVKMILDSGCSSTLISIAEAKYLYEKGCITQEDILGTTQSRIADGSIVENMVVKLRELVIGGKIVCSDVAAIVSSNAQAPLLLGNEVLNRAPSYSVNNQEKIIKFKLR